MCTRARKNVSDVDSSKVTKCKIARSNCIICYYVQILIIIIIIIIIITIN